MGLRSDRDWETIQIESKTSSSTTSWGGNDSSGDSTNIHNHGRPLRMPDEIRRMCDRWVVVLEQGVDPFRLRRLDYRTDKECRKRFTDEPGAEQSLGKSWSVLR